MKPKEQLPTGYTGDLKKLCKCGHEKGDHAIEDPYGKRYKVHRYCMHNCKCQKHEDA